MKRFATCCGTMELCKCFGAPTSPVGFLHGLPRLLSKGRSLALQPGGLPEQIVTDHRKEQIVPGCGILDRRFGLLMVFHSFGSVGS